MYIEIPISDTRLDSIEDYLEYFEFAIITADRSLLESEFLTRNFPVARSVIDLFNAQDTKIAYPFIVH